jgi:hypothetical protein
MVLLGNVCPAEACFGLFQTYHRHRNHFGRTQGYPQVMWVKWNLILVRLEIVLILAQDRYTVCTKCSTGTKMALGTTNGTPR